MKKNTDKNFIKYSFFIFCLLVAVSWSYIFSTDPESLSKLFDSRNTVHLSRFIGRLFGINEEVPAFFDKEMWKQAISLSIQTFQMSILATGIATFGMLVFVLFSAKNIVNGELTLHRHRYYKPFYYISRTAFLVTRAIPELTWAMILVFILKPGILPGALALALHNFGVLGKLCCEVIEDMNEKPIRNMSLNGAGELQLLFYGIFPDILPKYINYILYRLENIIRATLIVGFVGAGGLGLQFKLAMGHLKYSEILLYLICYLIMVYITDMLSTLAKRFIR